MERSIRDIMTRVEALLERVERQPADVSRDELHAIRTALKGLLSVAQAKTARRPPFDGPPA